MQTIDLDTDELDQLIDRVTEAKEKGLALSPEDYQLLLDVLLNFVNLQARMGENDITLRKLQKLAGLIPASESRKPQQKNREKTIPKKSKLTRAARNRIP